MLNIFTRCNFVNGMCYDIESSGQAHCSSRKSTNMGIWKCSRKSIHDRADLQTLSL